jgi:hypothetical protein
MRLPMHPKMGYWQFLHPLVFTALLSTTKRSC